MGEGREWRRWTGDPILLGLCLSCSGLGLALVYSATRYSEACRDLPQKQLLATALGVGLYLLCAGIDLRRLMKHWRWVLAGNILGLLSLLTPLGTAGNTGNRSWLAIPGVPFHLQPAEFVKLFYLLLLAWQLSRLKETGKLRRFSAACQLGGHLALMTGLLFAVSGDAGMAVVYGILFLLLCWTAGLPRRWFLLGGAAAGLGGVLLWRRLPADNYWKLRLLVLADHELDPQGVGFQQTRSLQALANGGLCGEGYLHGTLSQSAASSALPARYTDFIFSVCGEEWGYVGCCLVLLLLLLAAGRCVQLGLRTGEPFLLLTAVGCGGTLAVQTLLNVGMCLYAAPVIGLTLPFFSYGGSSVLALYMSMGVAASLPRNTPPNRLKW